MSPKRYGYSRTCDREFGLKKKLFWPEIRKTKADLAIRERISNEITNLQTKTGVPLAVLLSAAGITRRTWTDWQKRKHDETQHNGQIPKAHWLLPEEIDAIVHYARCRTDKKLQGYRRLTWMMVDENIAFASPSSIYRVLKEHNLLNMWSKTHDTAKKKGFDQPLTIHEQWHTDISYIRIQNIFYYFVSVMDGFSRMILVWDLFISMEELTVEIIMMRAKEKYPEANPRLITDNGAQFVGKDFKELLTLLVIDHTFTSPAHPQSNGKLERFHRSFKTEHVRVTAYTSLEQAKQKMSVWIDYYNKERLHSSLNYLTPQEVFEGKTEMRLAERKKKLYTARALRKSVKKQILLSETTL
ncbi:MAG: IS3 family transposase [Candidatus Kryptoniota bacterium]